MKTKSKFKSFLSVLLALTMLLSTFPMITHAAQSNEYVDPADSWISSNNRTNELDVNSTTTYETQYCYICAKQTMVITYRVPEYTKSGDVPIAPGPGPGWLPAFPGPPAAWHPFHAVRPPGCGGGCCPCRS